MLQFVSKEISIHGLASKAGTFQQVLHLEAKHAVQPNRATFPTIGARAYSYR